MEESIKTTAITPSINTVASFSSRNIEIDHNKLNLDGVTMMYQDLLNVHKNAVDQYIIGLTSVLLLGNISKPEIEARLTFAVRAIFDNSGMYPRRILEFIFIFKQIFRISDGIKSNLIPSLIYISFSNLSEIEQEIVFKKLMETYELERNIVALKEIRKFISVFPNLMIFEVNCLFMLYQNKVIKTSMERIIEKRNLKTKRLA